MVLYRAEYMVGGTKWVHRKMIESTRELKVVYAERRIFFK
jgi:hypothetical protein